MLQDTGCVILRHLWLTSQRDTGKQIVVVEEISLDLDKENQRSVL
jgi:hypothetical protein